MKNKEELPKTSYSRLPRVSRYGLCCSWNDCLITPSVRLLSCKMGIVQNIAHVPWSSLAIRLCSPYVSAKMVKSYAQTNLCVSSFMRVIHRLDTVKWQVVAHVHHSGTYSHPSNLISAYSIHRSNRRCHSQFSLRLWPHWLSHRAGNPWTIFLKDCISDNDSAPPESQDGSGEEDQKELLPLTIIDHSTLLLPKPSSEAGKDVLALPALPPV